MVGFVQSPAVEGAAEGEKEDIKSQPPLDSKKPPIPNDPLDLCIPEFQDFSSSFSDSFLDFESINAWFVEGNSDFYSDINMADLGAFTGELEDSKESLDKVSGVCAKDGVGEVLGVKEASLLGLEQEEGDTGVSGGSVEMGSQEACERINVDGVRGGDGSGRKSGDLGCLIEEQLGNVSLEGSFDCLIPVVASENDKNVVSDVNVVNGVEVSGGDGSKIGEAVNLDDRGARFGGVHAGDVAGVNGIGLKIDDTVSDEDESSSDAVSGGEGSSSSSASSSSSSSSDEEEGDENTGVTSGGKKAKSEIDMEEGEIVSSDVDELVGWSENEDAEDDGGGSVMIGPIKSKNELEVLPPVPSVTMTLQPHHQILPVGTILSMIGPQVIVEGVERHNPLNEGSILWITESRLPLGIIDEIFGPVKNPYYVVRYNSETEVPAGIQQGTSISFVPEFANHVLNNRSLYQKGYDASGENDEELLDEVDFSDDEKEAEYRRMLKMKKRGTNESKPGTNRKDKRHLKNQAGNWNRNRDPAAQTPPVSESQYQVPFVATSSGIRQDMAGDQSMVPPFSHGAQAPGLSASSGIFSGLQHQHHQSIGIPGGLPANTMPWMQQNQPYPSHQTPLQTSMAFLQQISTIPGFPLNFNPLGGQANFGVGPSLGPWPTHLDQNMLNALQFGMGLQAQNAPLPQNGGGEPAVQSQESQSNPNSQTSPANLGKPPKFNQGRGGGRKGQYRGRGGRFGGRRGRHPSR